MKALNDLEEKLILKKVQTGNRETFAEIYDLYVVKIFRFIYLKTNSKETAEDLTSEVFLKGWKYLKNNDGDNRMAGIDKVSSFLYKIARNTIIDFYRKKQILTIGIDEKISDAIRDQSQDILANISARQDIEEIMKTLGEIKDEYREVVILRYVEDLPVSEIAEITGKTEGAARVLIHRAVKSLEKALKLRENERN